VVDDPGFAAELRAGLMRAMKSGAERKAKKRWDREPMAHRFFIWICYGLTRAIVGLIGHSQWN
jgi:cardiolipin synthase